MTSNIYIDTSVVIAILLDQDHSKKYQQTVSDAKLYSHELILSECFSVAKREFIPFSDMQNALEVINIVTEIPQLPGFLEEILEIGYCRGADLHHLACAKFLDPDATIGFLTADKKQREIAKLVGFKTEGFG